MTFYVLDIFATPPVSGFEETIYENAIDWHWIRGDLL
jgi:hypothetical protein